jgi:hypothetical protein
MRAPNAAWADESGLVGKIIVIWLVIVVLLGVAVIDTASIMFARFGLSDAATVAAVTGATTYRNTRQADTACEAAQRAAEEEETDATITKNFCRVDQATGEVTIVMKKKANTLVADLLPFTERYTKIVVKEVGRPSSL